MSAVVTVPIRDSSVFRAPSDGEARRALARAMVSIGRASDPELAFREHEEAIMGAVRVLGPRHASVKRLLGSLGKTDLDYEDNRLANERELPLEAREAFEHILREGRGLKNERIAFVEAIGSGAEGYDFNYSVDGELHGAFAIHNRGAWVFAPGPVGREDLFGVTTAFRRYFEVSVAMAMHARGLDDDVIEAARDEVRPVRALWPDERDPRGLSDAYPLVFLLHNAANTEREFYCGWDPMTGRAEPYDYL